MTTWIGHQSASNQEVLTLSTFRFLKAKQNLENYYRTMEREADVTVLGLRPDPSHFT